MLNNVILVGRLYSDIEIDENEKGVKIILATPRPFKNENGEYETDFIPVIIYNGIAENVKAYCQKGDVIGIKGRIQGKDNEIQLIAEKVTFLSSSHKEEE